MTLIAAAKINKEGFVISDFRITTPSCQGDIVNKSINIDNKICIFMAGSISILKEIKAELNSYVEVITYDNVDRNDSILLTIIKNKFEEYGKDSSIFSDFIVIYLDKPKDQFKLFKVEVRLENDEWDCNVFNGNSFIIGSGNLICNQNSSEFMIPIYEKVRIKYDEVTAVKAVEYEITRRLRRLGKEVYNEKGISPVFQHTFIIGSEAKTKSVEIEGMKFTLNKEAEEYNYKFEDFAYSLYQNDDSSINIRDIKNNNNILIQSADNKFNISSNKFNISSNKLDPEGREK